jgi:protein-disulfide isomerase
MSDAPRTLSVPVNETDHALGPADAPVTLVEYGDYECPDCLNAFPIIKRLIADFGPASASCSAIFP